MLKFEKVATPPTAATVAVPESAPPPGLVPMVSVMLVVALVTVLPPPSCTITVTAGLMAVPAVAPVGWTEKASLTAAPVTLKVALVAPVRPVAAAVSV